VPKLEAALFEYLTESGTNTQAAVDDRVYPLRLPEKCLLPAIAYQRVAASRNYTFDPYEETSAFVTARVQFSCWSNSALEAMNVGEAVLLDLSGYGGDMSGVLVGSSFSELERDDYEPDVKLYRRLLDFAIGYEDDISGPPVS
jgi:hypothetical protein